MYEMEKIKFDLYPLASMRRYARKQLKTTHLFRPQKRDQKASIA